MGRPPPSGACADQRLLRPGWRKIILKDTDTLQCDHDLTDYTARCLALGLPPSSSYQIDETLLLEANFDLLNGISWTKGCYVARSTARMHYRGGVKKRLVPITTPNPAYLTLATDLTLEKGRKPGNPLTHGKVASHCYANRSGGGHSDITASKLFPHLLHGFPTMTQTYKPLSDTSKLGNPAESPFRADGLVAAIAQSATAPHEVLMLAWMDEGALRRH